MPAKLAEHCRVSLLNSRSTVVVRPQQCYLKPSTYSVALKISYIMSTSHRSQLIVTNVTQRRLALAEGSEESRLALQRDEVSFMVPYFTCTRV